MADRKVAILNGWKKFLEVQLGKLIGGLLQHQTVTLELFRGQIANITLTDTELRIDTTGTEYCKPGHPLERPDNHKWRPSSQTTFRYPLSSLCTPVRVGDHFHFQCGRPGSADLYPKDK